MSKLYTGSDIKVGAVLEVLKTATGCTHARYLKGETYRVEQGLEKVIRILPDTSEYWFATPREIEQDINNGILKLVQEVEVTAEDLTEGAEFEVLKDFTGYAAATYRAGEKYRFNGRGRIDRVNMTGKYSVNFWVCDADDLVEDFKTGNLKLIQEGKDMGISEIKAVKVIAVEELGKYYNKDNKFGLVEGDTVECVALASWYDEGKTYSIGYDGDFGVKDYDADVMPEGRITSGDSSNSCDFSWDTFTPVGATLERLTQIPQEPVPLKTVEEVKQLEVGDRLLIGGAVRLVVDVDKSDSYFTLQIEGSGWIDTAECILGKAYRLNAVYTYADTQDPVDVSEPEAVATYNAEEFKAVVEDGSIKIMPKSTADKDALTCELVIGDHVECLVSGNWYHEGRVYTVGDDGDFGVMDSMGDVMSYGDFSSSDFVRSNWKKVN